MQKEKLIEITFTTVIVFLIVLPLPPSTIIGIALATNPVTGKFMNKTAFRVTQTSMRFIGKGLKAPIKVIAMQQQTAAQKWVR